MTALANGQGWSKAEYMAMTWPELQFWSEQLRAFFEEQAVQAQGGS
ncbi:MULTISPECIES: hypothetical protein [Acetobacter]|uniref:Uncharacterized protein n=1 Tax=Acetobacter lovaniensis TaxID=104100 RepID=A0A841QGI8_9PROT|nr:hypothetical protein [Acetobacter lovaniensis]MBB6457465.1 hypothetical protein [Acetobacter lovaniensis]NHN81763.1 hypothetical protein [Acetobacter lovaniensis]GBQ70905.1 hypothetical protein AA0474_2311 [Acetobacter lovaniensis NRIC 0474]